MWNSSKETFFTYYLRKDRDGDVQMTGAKVDLEEARREKLCFNCGKQGSKNIDQRIPTKQKDQKKNWRTAIVINSAPNFGLVC
jgi:hypothetical protein